MQYRDDSHVTIFVRQSSAKCMLPVIRALSEKYYVIFFIRTKTRLAHFRCGTYRVSFEEHYQLRQYLANPRSMFILIISMPIVRVEKPQVIKTSKICYKQGIWYPPLSLVPAPTNGWRYTSFCSLPEALDNHRRSSRPFAPRSTFHRALLPVSFTLIP